MKYNFGLTPSPKRQALLCASSITNQKPTSQGSYDRHTISTFMQLTRKRMAIQYQSFALKRRATRSNQQNSIGREKPDVSMENDIVVVALLT